MFLLTTIMQHIEECTMTETHITTEVEFFNTKYDAERKQRMIANRTFHKLQYPKESYISEVVSVTTMSHNR